MTEGYVYILINSSMRGLVKIGETSRNPEQRASELSKPTGIPTPFEVAYEEFVQDRKTVEKLLHTELAPYREEQNREFFRISLNEAIKALRKIAENLENKSQQSMVDNVPNIQVSLFAEWCRMIPPRHKATFDFPKELYRLKAFIINKENMKISNFEVLIEFPQLEKYHNRAGPIAGQINIPTDTDTISFREITKNNEYYYEVIYNPGFALYPDIPREETIFNFEVLSRAYRPELGRVVWRTYVEDVQISQPQEIFIYQLLDTERTSY